MVVFWALAKAGKETCVKAEKRQIVLRCFAAAVSIEKGSWMRLSGATGGLECPWHGERIII